ncbi:MAG: phage integrase SAM-like domain-containing protein [Mangrovibacterium sp.]
MLNKGVEEKAYQAIISEKIEYITISLTLDTRNIEDILPVAIRVNANRKTRFYRTGLKVTLKEWEAIYRAKGPRGDNYETKKSQKAIYDKVKKIVEELLRTNKFSFENLKIRLTGDESNTFNDYWKAFAETKKVGTKLSYMDACNSFEKYIGKNVEFTRIGVELIKKWEKKLIDDGVSNTTIGMYFRACRAVINDAIDSGKINPNQYPFGKKKIPIRKGRNRTDEFLSVSEIKQLMNFKAPDDHWFQSYEKIVYEAINLWLFSYLGNGLNLADMAQLKYDSHYFQSGATELKFIRQKTKDTTDEDIEVIIPVIPELQMIIDRYGTKPEPGGYIFPFILNGEVDPEKIKKIVHQWNSNIRDRVQNACKLLGITKPVGMTWARHSFATNLTNVGVSERYISQAMGHSIKSVTQGYIGLFPPEKRMKFNKMLLEE